MKRKFHINVKLKVKFKNYEKKNNFHKYALMSSNKMQFYFNEIINVK